MGVYVCVCVWGAGPALRAKGIAQPVSCPLPCRAGTGGAGVGGPR